MKQLTKPARPAVAAMAVAAVLAFPAQTARAGDIPYLGDIIAVAYSYCPVGWEPADGQLLPISNYSALFALYGTTYGGDGRSSFGLPDLRRRAASEQGATAGPGLTPRDIGEEYGQPTQTLTVSQMPAHAHTVNANNLDGNFPGPADKVLAAAPSGGSGNETIYSGQPADTTMSPQMITQTGDGQPLATQDPYLAMQYCVAVYGEFPPRE